MTMSTTSAYSGLDSSPPPGRTRRNLASRGASSSSTNAADSINDDDEDWHQIEPGTDDDDPPMKSKRNYTNERNSHLSPSSSFEIGHDDDDDDDDDDEYSSDNDDEEDYDLSDQYTPTLNQHLSGRTTLLRPRTITCRCSILMQAVASIAALLAVLVMIRNGPSLKNNLRRHPDNNNKNKNGGGEMITVVAHAAYEALHSSRLEEYDAQLTLYRHKATGAEFLSYIPHSKEGKMPGGGASGGKTNGGGSGGSQGYDPKPDKVFGVAFRTKPESSTGVPHILERELLSSPVRPIICF